MQWKGCSSVINIQKGVQLLRMPGNFLARLLGFPFYFPSLTPQSSPDSPDSKQNQQNKQSKGQRILRICKGIEWNGEQAKQKANKHPHMCMFYKQRWLTAENARNLSQHTKYVPKDFQFIFTKTILPACSFSPPLVECIRRYCRWFCNRGHRENTKSQWTENQWIEIKLKCATNCKSERSWSPHVPL